MDAIVGIDQRGDWTANNGFNRSFDHLCSGYDDVLAKRDTP